LNRGVAHDMGLHWEKNQRRSGDGLRYPQNDDGHEDDDGDGVGEDPDQLQAIL